MIVLCDIRWRPGIGDPDALGWVTTVCYFLAAGAVFRAWWREREAEPQTSEILLPQFWGVLAIAMTLLGFNKQLDVQTLVTEIGRAIAESLGVYGERRGFQLVFVLLMAGGGVAGLVYLYRLLIRRGVWRRYRTASIGVVYLFTFVIIRASSFHHVDWVLYHWLGSKVNVLLEMGGIITIAVGAMHAIKQEYPRKYQVFEKTVRVR